MASLKNIWGKCIRTRKHDQGKILETELKRCLSTFDLIMLGISNTVGGGIYVIAGTIANEITGPALFLSFIIAAFAHFLNALCLAEFGCQIPKAGSTFMFVYVTIGELTAFTIGWNFVLTGMFDASVSCRGVISYFNEVTEGAVDQISPDVFVQQEWEFYAGLLVLGIVSVTFFGIKQSAWLNSVLSIINISTIFFVIICSFVLADFSNWDNFLPFGYSSIFKGSTKAYFVFTGYDIITQAAEETIDPSKSIPKALIVTITFLTFTYSILTAAMSLALPYTDISRNAALVSIFEYHNWPWADYISSFGILSGFLGQVMCSILCIARLCYALAYDGLLFPFLCKVNKTTQVPIFSTAFAAICVTVISTFISLGEITEMLAFGNLVANSLLAIALIVTRYSDKELFYTAEKPAAETTAADFENQPLLEQSNKGWKNKQIVLFACFVLLSIFSMGFLSAYYDTRTESYMWVFIVIVILAFCFLICFWKTSREVSKNNKSFRVPLIPFLPSMSLFLNCCIISQMQWPTWLFSGSWALLGLVVYFVYGMKHSHLEAKEGKNGSVENESVEMERAIIEDKEKQ